MNIEEKWDMEEFEFRLTKALERMTVIDAENCKLRYEFELLREKWLSIERMIDSIKGTYEEKK